MPFYVVDLRSKAVLFTAEAREQADAWAQSNGVGLVMDDAGLRRAKLRGQAFERPAPPPAPPREPVQRPKHVQNRQRPFAVYVRMSGEEVDALDALRQTGESRADVVRRLVKTQ